jgi:hypothetical protein
VNQQEAHRLSHASVEIARSSLPAPVISYDVVTGRWRLEADYTNLDDPHRITVPSRFSFNLASVTRAFWWLMAPFELSIVAPLTHDFLYRHRGRPPAGAIVPPRSYDRKQSDQLFRRLMTLEGVPAWRRSAAYRAVRWFGGAGWGRESR